MKICKSCAFTVWPRSLSTPLPLQSPKTISTFKCISPTIYHPVVYTARKGRRQLPSENIQLSISNTHLKHRLCVTSWAGGQKGVTSRRMSEKHGSDHFMRGYVISLSFVCVCGYRCSSCLHVHMWQHWSWVYVHLHELSVGYQRVHSGHGGSLLSAFASHSTDALSPTSALCHSATNWHI